MPLAATIVDYWKLTKPRIWALLVFTGLVAMLVAYRETGRTPSIAQASVMALALVLGSAAADVLTNYNDRDIDRVMKRTMDRALPSGRISPRPALALGLVMAALSVVVAWSFDLLAAIFMSIGLLDNVVIYSVLLKRRSWSSVILGGVSGGMPVLVGYAGVADAVSPVAWFMSILVMVWIPTHIWSLALAGREDYEAARIPALPVVYGNAIGTACVAAASGLLVVFSLAVYFVRSISVFYLVAAAAAGIPILAYSAKLLVDRKVGTAWTLFKLTSPYLAIVFAVLGTTA